MGFIGVQVRLESDLIGEGVQVQAFEGREVLNQLFDFNLHVVAAEGFSLEAEEVLSQPVAVVFEVDDAFVDGQRTGPSVWREVRRVHGLICECEDLLFEEDLSTYRLRVVPRFWLASLVETLDIYMDLTVPQIIAEKLKRLGLLEDEDFELRLTSGYPVWEFLVQYQETDLALISRLSEHNGITFSFEQTETHDVLVFSDNNGAFSEITDQGVVPFVQQGQRLGVFELSARTTMVPKTFVQRDYNYRTPQSDLMASVEMSDGAAGGIIEYGGHFKDEADGQRLAEVRKQEQRARRHVFRGAGTDPRLRAGARFSLEGHPRGDVDLIVTELRHRAGQSTLHGGEGQAEGYSVEFSALSINTVYRPPRLTPKPRIHGFLTGIIDGTPGDNYAPIDEQGRYLVRFMFDTAAPGERKASRPVRMMQPHAGAGYGMHFPLRVGTEVLIAFLGGDPDRPIITGTVPNPQTESPVKAENHRKNVIRTGGGNEFDIDDTEEEQRIKISTPRASAVFQLGAPNAAEDGAFLGTANNITSTAGGMSSGMSSVTDLWSAYHDAWSNHIVGFAGAMPPFLKLQYVDAWAQGVANVVSSMLGATLSVRDGIIAQKQVALDGINASKDEASEELAEKTATRNEDRAALERCFICDDRPRGDGDDDPLAELSEAMTAYDEALQQREDDQAELLALEGERDSAIEAGLAQSAYELEQVSIPEKEAIVAADEVALGEAKARLDASLAVIRANSGDYQCTCQTSPDSEETTSIAQRAAAFGTSNDAMVSADQTYEQLAESASCLEDQIEADGEKLAGVDAAKQGIDAIVGVESTFSGLLFSLITALCGDGVQIYARDTADFMLEEALLQYRGSAPKLGLPTTGWSPFPPFIKMIPPVPLPPVLHQTSDRGVLCRSGDWAEEALKGLRATTQMKPKAGAGIVGLGWASLMALLPPPVGPALAAKFGRDAFNESRNIQGSEDHVVLFGKKSAYLTGHEHTTVSSYGRVVITSDERTVVHARGKAEIAGGETFVSASDVVDVCSRGEIWLQATGPADGVSVNSAVARWNDPSADKIRGLLKLTRGAVTLTSKKKDGSADVATLKLTADDTNDVGTAELKTGDTHYIKLEQKAAADTSTLTVETPGSFKINAAKNGEIIAAEKLTLKIGTDGPSIEMSADGIMMKAGDKAALELKKDLAVLKFGSATVVKCDSNGVSVINGTSNKVLVSNSGVDIKGAMMKHG